MKPFDLEAAKRGEPIVTRAGQIVSFIAHVPAALPGHRVVVLNPGRVAVGYHENGIYSALGLESRKDLFMAPEAPQSLSVTAVKDKKPFDLKKFKAGAVAVLNLSNGKAVEVTFVAHVPNAAECDSRVIGLTDQKELTFTTEAGSFGTNGRLSLTMKPTTVERWVNLYANGAAHCTETLEEADTCAKNASGRLGVRLGGQAYRIEIEE